MAKVKVAVSKGKSQPVTVDDWLTEDGLLLLESWARDGYTMMDISNKMGIDNDRFLRWKDRYPEIAEAVRKGKELVDYKVENALLKSALGYKTKEVKVTTTMRYGKVVETIKEVTDKEVAPNVSAIQMWLYNRQKEKWKNMNVKNNILDEMEEDSSFEIVVTRANKNESGNNKSATDSNTDSNNDDFDTGMEEKEVKVRKRTKSEAEEEKEKKEKKAAKQKANTVVEEEDESQVVDLDEWPDDWEDDE